MAHASSQIGDRTLGAIRPGVEAILLAAMALGCAQAGWEILTPRFATAANPPPSDEPESTAAMLEADVVSPFAPEGAAYEGASSAASALVATLHVVGVRMADDPTRSGAIIELQDGQQGAFLVGDEIGAGVQLTAVDADGIEVAIAGARRVVPLQQEAGVSFARAMMGLSPVDAAPAATASAAPTHVVVAANEAEPAASPASAPAVGDAAWLAATISAVERDASGAPIGWRVAASAPGRVRAAGLKPGDLVVAVNGVAPGAAATLAGLDPRAPVTLTVQHADNARETIRIEVGAPT